MANGEDALEAAHEETTNPEVDNEAHEVLTSEILTWGGHLTKLVPGLSIFLKESLVLINAPEIKWSESTSGLEAVNVDNDQASETEAALCAAETLEQLNSSDVLGAEREVYDGHSEPLNNEESEIEAENCSELEVDINEVVAGLGALVLWVTDAIGLFSSPWLIANFLEVLEHRWLKSTFLGVPEEGGSGDQQSSLSSHVNANFEACHAFASVDTFCNGKVGHTLVLC